MHLNQQHLGQKKTRFPHNIISFHNTCLQNIDCERKGSKSEQDLCRSSHFIHQVCHKLSMAWSPVGLISPMDRALHPVIAKVRLRFPVRPKFFQIPKFTFIFLSTVQNRMFHIFQFKKRQCYIQNEQHTQSTCKDKTATKLLGDKQEGLCENND